MSLIYDAEQDYLANLSANHAVVQPVGNDRAKLLEIVNKRATT